MSLPIRKKHYNEIDALYTIGIILVMIGHSHSSDWTAFEGTILYSLIRFIYVFHMPLFYTIAGFLFMNSDSLEKRGFRQWVYDKALRLLVPYFFWSILGLLPKYYVENGGYKNLSITYLIETIVIPRKSVWGHFWFLPVLFLTYVVFALWKIYVNEHNITLMLLISFGACGLFYFVPIKTEILGLADLHNSLLFFCIGLILCVALNQNRTNQSVSFKMCGVQKNVILNIFCSIAIIVSAILTEAAYEIRVIGLLVALLMISVCIVVSTCLTDKRLCTWISKFTFTIYIFSWLFQSVMMFICEHFGIGWKLTFIAMFVIGLLGPMCIIWFYKHIPKLIKRPIKYIFGMR